MRFAYYVILERCNPWPHVVNRDISQASYCHCDVTHYDVSRLRRSRRSQPPFWLWRHSHCDVIRYWAGHAQRYGCTNVRTYGRTPYRVLLSQESSHIDRHERRWK